MCNCCPRDSYMGVVCQCHMTTLTNQWSTCIIVCDMTRFVYLVAEILTCAQLVLC